MPSPLIKQKRLEPWQEILAPQSIGYRLKILTLLLARKFQERLEPYGLTPFHWVVLCCLWEEDGLATSEIGEKLQQVGGTITGVLDRMEERGVIRRQRDSQDRRVCRIWLTDAGQELETVLVPIAQELREQAMQGISPQDRQHFSELIDQQIANLS